MSIGAANQSEYHLEDAIPSISAYRRLRAEVGWHDLPADAIGIGLQNSLYSICAYQNSSLVGCGRIVGDGGVYFYIQDVIVLPEHQGHGLGKQIMARLMEYLQQHAQANAFIGLMAAAGVEGFYTKYGFERRPSDRPGMFLIWGS